MLVSVCIPLSYRHVPASRLARSSVTQAYHAGVKLQRVEILLPLIGATDLDDWPGGIQQQFKVPAPTDPFT